MRFREKHDASTPVPCTRVLTQYTGSGSDPYHVEPLSYSYCENVEVTSDRVMEDVDTPGFYRDVRKGNIRVNDMTSYTWTTISDLVDYTNHFVYDEWVNSPYSVWARRGYSQTGKWSSKVLIPLTTSTMWEPLPTLTSDSLIDLAVSGAWSKVTQAEAAALVTLAEAHKTVSGITGILKRAAKIYQMYRGLKKFEYKAARGLVKELKPRELANRYMEVRYGIRPLVYDTVQILRAYDSPAAKRGRLTFRHTKSDSLSSTSNVTINHGDYTREYYREAKKSIRVRAGVLAELERISSLYKWGLASVPQAAWELVPLSFVWDWFFNIGDTIAAWTPKGGLKALASWYTLEVIDYQKTSVTKCTNILPSGNKRVRNFSHILDNCSHTIIGITKNRCVDPNRPLIPTFEVKLSPAKILDLGIIASQFVRR